MQVGIIATISTKTGKASLVENIVVTDDVAPPFMRSNSQKHIHLSKAFTSLTPITAGSAQATAFLTAHNNYRAKHGAAALTWDNTLAAAADAYASKCVFAHDPNRGANIGENIFADGSSSPLSPTDPTWGSQATTDWYNEISDWNFATSTGNAGKVTGHFTQVVWKATTHLGCGVASCPGMLMANSIFVVCRYNPAGNFLCPTCTPPSTYANNVS